MVQRVHVRTITNDEGTKLLRMVRRSSGSVVTWRRAQMVLLSAQASRYPNSAPPEQDHRTTDGSRTERPRTFESRERPRGAARTAYQISRRRG